MPLFLTTARLRLRVLRGPSASLHYYHLHHMQLQRCITYHFRLTPGDSKSSPNNAIHDFSNSYPSSALPLHIVNHSTS